ncbi:PAS domain-containing hybrid sensor histidine kinase/response regulator [Parachryseolinea silvisoli]|uniref:PAS domain-containing hybrid sensor histidine kinase/response regulator n=1 Tax=Parachryseolinea silvisoli TaxID=2873601 RepID=UPI00226583C6|nr:PAS domain-containing hybrid sensor histidine kinase/response regulator [Parachryseolinea silvisoli]MCD9013994.1 response regulator [Parachryseolinea silvisoli]
MAKMKDDAQTGTIAVDIQLLQKVLELSEAMANGDFSKRIVIDFDDSPLAKIAAHLNEWADQVQLNSVEKTHEQTVNSFIEVISSFANHDFTQKLSISENGTVMDAIATGINILGEELQQTTASKLELETERNKLNEAQSIAKVGSWELDGSLLTLKASHEAYRILGLTKNDTANLFDAFRKKVHKDYLPKLNHLIRSAIEKKEDFVLEMKIVQDDQSVKDVLCIGEALADETNAVVNLKGTIQDISERKQIEQSLQEAKEFAEEANNSKSKFLANMSHEIRTPLNGILGLTQIMLGEQISDEHRGYLEVVHESGKSLARLVNDILDLSKIENKKLQLESITFDFHKTISATVNSYKFLADQKGLTLSCHIDPLIPAEVIGDPTRVSQVLTNLISNAIKFTEEGSIDIRLALHARKSAELVIHGTVTDTGFGIPKEKLDLIFQSFTQADDSITRKYGGTGLGLSIVKNLLAQMKGSVSVESPADPVRNTGSIFRFSLTLNVPGRLPSETQTTNTQKKLAFKNPVTILVVDDNPMNLLVAKKMLKKFGAEVTITQSGFDAIDLVKRTQFNLVLMDIQMPGINGYETTAEMRRLNFTMPILALSANGYEDDIRQSLASGMNYHITKPYTEQHFFETVNKYIESDAT